MRKFAAVALAAALLLGTTGCSFNPNPESLRDYAPSEGSETELGDVMVNNVLVLTNPLNEQTLIVGSIVNSGLTAETVLITQPSPTGNVVLFESEIAPGQKLDLGFNGGPAVSLAPTQDSFPAGSLVKLSFAASGVSEFVNVPILDDTFAHFNDIVDSLVPPTPVAIPEN